MERTPMEYFLAVCESGSINKAGHRLGVTPQAVSKAIAQFEKDLGYDLLERSKAGCVLTEKGREVQRIGLRQLRFNEQTALQLKSLNTRQSKGQEVHIGVWGHFATIMPWADYADFHTLYPDIVLCVHSYPDVGPCEAGLIAGETELAFCPPDQDSGIIVCLQEYANYPYLIVSGRSPLSRKRQVQLSELQCEKLIAEYAPDGKSIDFQKDFAAAGLTPSLILPALSNSLEWKLVLQSDYVAISRCPTGWLPYGIVPIALPELNYYNAACFSRAADHVLSEAAQKYADYIVPRFEKDIFGGIQH